MLQIQFNFSHTKFYKQIHKYVHTFKQTYTNWYQCAVLVWQVASLAASLAYSILQNTFCFSPTERRAIQLNKEYALWGHLFCASSYPFRLFGGCNISAGITISVGGICSFFYIKGQYLLPYGQKKQTYCLKVNKSESWPHRNVIKSFLRNRNPGSSVWLKTRVSQRTMVTWGPI